MLGFLLSWHSISPPPPSPLEGKCWIEVEENKLHPWLPLAITTNRAWETRCIQILYFTVGALLYSLAWKWAQLLIEDFKVCLKRTHKYKMWRQSDEWTSDLVQAVALGPGLKESGVHAALVLFMFPFSIMFPCFHSIMFPFSLCIATHYCDLWQNVIRHEGNHLSYFISQTAALFG